MKKIFTLLLCAISFNVLGANVTSYDPKTGKYTVDKFGSKKESSRRDSRLNSPRSYKKMKNRNH